MSEPLTGRLAEEDHQHEITVTSFGLSQAAADALFERVVEAAHALDESVICIGTLTPSNACHCGRPVLYGFDGNPRHHRGMCEGCDTVRCDAYPMECPYR